MTIKLARTKTSTYFAEKNLIPINEKTINKNAVAKIKEYWLIRLYKLLSLVITAI